MADATLTVDAEDQATLILSQIHDTLMGLGEAAEQQTREIRNAITEIDKMTAAEHKRREESKKARAAEVKETKMAVAEITEAGKTRRQENKQTFDLEKEQAKQSGKETLESLKSNLKEEGEVKKQARAKENAQRDADRDRQLQSAKQAGAERLERIKQEGKQMLALIKQETQEMNAERRSGMSDELRARIRLHKEQREAAKSAAKEDRDLRKLAHKDEIQQIIDDPMGDKQKELDQIDAQHRKITQSIEGQRKALETIDDEQKQITKPLEDQRKALQAIDDKHEKITQSIEGQRKALETIDAEQEKITKPIESQRKALQDIDDKYDKIKQSITGHRKILQSIDAEQEKITKPIEDQHKALQDIDSEHKSVTDSLKEQGIALAKIEQLHAKIRRLAEIKQVNIKRQKEDPEISKQLDKKEWNIFQGAEVAWHQELEKDISALKDLEKQHEKLVASIEKGESILKQLDAQRMPNDKNAAALKGLDDRRKATIATIAQEEAALKDLDAQRKRTASDDNQAALRDLDNRRKAVVDTIAKEEAALKSLDDQRKRTAPDDSEAALRELDAQREKTIATIRQEEAALKSLDARRKSVDAAIKADVDTDEKRKSELDALKEDHKQRKKLNDDSRDASLADQKAAQDREHKQLLKAQEQELNDLKLAGKEFKDEDQRRHAEQLAEMRVTHKEQRDERERYYDTVNDGIRQAHRESNAIETAEYNEKKNIRNQALKQEKREIDQALRSRIHEAKQSHELIEIDARTHDDEILALMDRRHAEELDEIKHHERGVLEDKKARHRRERDEYIESAKELRDQRLQDNKKAIIDIEQHYKELRIEAEQERDRQVADKKAEHDEQLAKNNAFYAEKLSQSNHARLMERQQRKHDQNMEMERLIQHNRERLKEQKKSNNKILNENSAFSKRFMRLAATTFSIAGISIAAHKVREYTGAILEALVSLEGMKFSLIAVEGNAERMANQLLRIRQIAKLPGVEFESAIKTTVTLRALKLEADLVERAIVAIGNALTTLGREGELGGVTLALSQIIGKGKIHAEEINQLAERLPVFRGIMVQEFGTANTELLQKMEINTTRFIEAMVEGLERMPKVATAIGTTLKNLRNEWFIFQASLGTLLKPTIMKALEGTTALLQRANEALDKANKRTEERQQQQQQTRKAQGIVEGMGMGTRQPFYDFFQLELPTNIDEVRARLEREQVTLESRMKGDRRHGTAKVNRSITDIENSISELQGLIDSMLAFQNPVHLSIDQLTDGLEAINAEIERREGLRGTRIGHGTAKLQSDQTKAIDRLEDARNIFEATLHENIEKSGMHQWMDLQAKRLEAAALETSIYNESIQKYVRDALGEGVGRISNRRELETLVRSESTQKMIYDSATGATRELAVLIRDTKQDYRDEVLDALAQEMIDAEKGIKKISKEIDPQLEKETDKDKRIARQTEIHTDLQEALNKGADALIESYSDMLDRLIKIEQDLFNVLVKHGQAHLSPGRGLTPPTIPQERQIEADTMINQAFDNYIQAVAGMGIPDLTKRARYRVSDIKFEMERGNYQSLMAFLQDGSIDQESMRKQRDVGQQDALEIRAKAQAAVTGKIKSFYSNDLKRWVLWESESQKEWQDEKKFRDKRDQQSMDLAYTRAVLDGKIKIFYSNDLKRWIIWDNENQKEWQDEKKFRDKRDQQSMDLAYTRAVLDGKIKKFYSNELKRWVIWENENQKEWQDEKKFRDKRDQQSMDLAYTRAVLSGNIKKFYSNELKRWVIWENENQKEWQDEKRFRDKRNQESQERSQMLESTRHHLALDQYLLNLGQDTEVPRPKQLRGMDQEVLDRLARIRQEQARMDIEEQQNPESLLPEPYRKQLKEYEQAEYAVQDAALQTANTIISAWDKVSEHTETMTDNVVGAIAQTVIQLTELVLNFQRTVAASSAASSAIASGGALGGLSGALAKVNPYLAGAAAVIGIGSTVYSLIDDRDDSRSSRNRVSRPRPKSISRR